MKRTIWQGWRVLVTTLLLGMSSVGAPAKATAPARRKPDIDVFAAADQRHPPAPGGVLCIGGSSIRLRTTLAADFPRRHHP